LTGDTYPWSEEGVTCANTLYAKVNDKLLRLAGIWLPWSRTSHVGGIRNHSSASARDSNTIPY